VWIAQNNDPSPNIEVLEALLRRGANPNQRFEHHSVWKLAIHHVQITHKEWSPPIQRPLWWQVFKLMLLHGADPNVRSCDHQQNCAQGDCDNNDVIGRQPVQPLTDYMLASGDCWSLKDVIIEVFSELGISELGQLLELLE
jgi:hypothetical protein